MKLVKVTLENFRGYRSSTELHVDDLTVLIGKNDAGKSTWLDALSIFFEEGSTKPDKKDVNITNAEDGIFSITVSLQPPDTLVIDATNPINLRDEYLLDENDLITIKKVYSNGKHAKTFLIAKHPDHDQLRDLLSKTINDVKALSESIGVNQDSIQGQKTKSATWRNAIREHIGDFETSLQEIQIDDAKDVWDTIKNQLPEYGLFKVDRNNQDQDPEAQDPFKTAIKEILKTEDVIESIKNLKEKVSDAYSSIAEGTIEELRKINPDIANQLHPNFGDPKIESAFKPEIDTDSGVPLNKRGSGVRRLVLLSFFKAEVLRRKTNKPTTNVIYAIEEPETSQHPEHQMMLIKALKEISEQESAQVIFTTHSAQLVKSLNFNILRFISFIDNEPYITTGEGVLAAAQKELGELPQIDQGYLVCVEGKNDAQFLKNIGKLDVFKQIIDISEASILPMNGGFIIKWAEEHYLEKVNVKEFHLYDRDSDEQYLVTANTVNGWEKGSAVLTTLREIENYVHPSLINEEFGTQLELNDNWKNMDVPQACAQQSGQSEATVKKTICGSLALKMTNELFDELGVTDEVKSWFEAIKQASE